MQNNANLNVSVAPIGFYQNTACISLGHSFNEKKRVSIQIFQQFPLSVRHLLLRKKVYFLTVHFESGHSTCVVVVIESDLNSLNGDIYTAIH